MNETTSTPEEPVDGRGAVATGGQADAYGRVAPASAESGGTSGADTPGPVVRATPSPRPSPRLPVADVQTDAAEPGTAVASAAPESGGGAAADAPAVDGDAAAERRTGGRAVEITSPSVQAGVPARPVQSSADGPTEQLAAPSSSNGSAARPDSEAAAEGNRPDGPSGSWAAPAPAPGPVPGPGPAAAAPPPWHRVPGQGPYDGADSYDRADSRDRAATTGPAGGLLEDGPTTFLEAPRRPANSAGEAQPESGGWAGLRSVRSRPPRQAALQLKRLDPWSVLKLALVLAVVLFFIWLVAVGVLYGVLDGMGVWDRLNGTYADLVSGEAPTGSPLISAGRVFGLAAVIGAINSLLFAVAVTVGAFVYNVSADLVGGIEVTLSERD